jgi:hypothetical protein
MWAPPSPRPLSGRRPLYKVPFSLGPASWEHMLPTMPRILSWRRVLPVGWWRPSVAGVTLVSCLCRSCRGHAALGKASVGGFRHLRRLGPLMMKSPAGCWRSWPFDRSRPLWPNIAVIPRTSAGRWLYPWPTQIVIPTTPRHRQLRRKLRRPANIPSWANGRTSCGQRAAMCPEHLACTPLLTTGADRAAG